SLNSGAPKDGAENSPRTYHWPALTCWIIASVVTTMDPCRRIGLGGNSAARFCTCTYHGLFGNRKCTL
ncbi:MAG: hypothetical protein ACK56F_06675, partial [bacterium]